MGKYSRYKKTP